RRPTAGTGAAAGAATAASGTDVTASTQNQLTKSFAGAEAIAQQYPASVQSEIIAAAKASFLQGDQWAYLAGIIAVLLGAAIVFFAFPKPADEKRMLAAFHAEDAADHSEHTEEPATAAAPPRAA